MVTLVAWSRHRLVVDTGIGFSRPAAEVARARPEWVKLALVGTRRCGAVEVGRRALALEEDD